MGKTGVQVSNLGFGCMRLPVIDGQPDQIDEAKATEMIHYAIDQGVNYIDTAYPYHGKGFGEPGMSEVFVGKVLQGGYRQKVHLATKLPCWMVGSRSDMDRLLNEQLQRLQTDRIDFYLLHSLQQDTWAKVTKLDVFSFLDQAIADGRIGYAGFSFHDEYPLFPEIIDAYPWSFCQIQYNYMDVTYQAGLKGLEYAAQKGMGVVIMEPLRGGRLATRIPADIQQLWDRAEVKRTPAGWALQYVWNHPAVSTVLSGMNEMAQVVENIQAAEQGYANAMTAKEKDLIAQVKKIYESRTKVDCTNCRYCMPCPLGVDIPGSFIQLNNASMYDDIKGARWTYQTFLSPAERASGCTECGRYEEICPQQLPIRERLKEVVRELES